MTFRDRIRRIRCWFLGYHVNDESGVGKFRYDCSGICYHCGVVGTGIEEDGE